MAAVDNKFQFVKQVAKKSTSKPPVCLNSGDSNNGLSTLTYNGLNGSSRNEDHLRTMSSTGEDSEDDMEEIDNRIIPEEETETMSINGTDSVSNQANSSDSNSHQMKRVKATARKSMKPSATAQQQIADIEKRQADMLAIAQNGNDSSQASELNNTDTNDTKESNGITNNTNTNTVSSDNIDDSNNSSSKSAQNDPKFKILGKIRTSFKGILNTITKPGVSSTNSDDTTNDFDNEPPAKKLAIFEQEEVAHAPEKSSSLDSCDKEVQRTLAGAFEEDPDSNSTSQDNYSANDSSTNDIRSTTNELPSITNEVPNLNNGSWDKLGADSDSEINPIEVVGETQEYIEDINDAFSANQTDIDKKDEDPLGGATQELIKDITEAFKSNQTESDGNVKINDLNSSDTNNTEDDLLLGDNENDELNDKPTEDDDALLDQEDEAKSENIKSHQSASNLSEDEAARESMECSVEEKVGVHNAVEEINDEDLDNMGEDDIMGDIECEAEVDDDGDEFMDALTGLQEDEQDKVGNLDDCNSETGENNIEAKLGSEKPIINDALEELSQSEMQVESNEVLSKTVESPSDIVESPSETAVSLPKNIESPSEIIDSQSENSSKSLSETLELAAKNVESPSEIIESQLENSSKSLSETLGLPAQNMEPSSSDSPINMESSIENTKSPTEVELPGDMKQDSEVKDNESSEPNDVCPKNVDDDDIEMTVVVQNVSRDSINKTIEMNIPPKGDGDGENDNSSSTLNDNGLGENVEDSETKDSTNIPTSDDKPMVGNVTDGTDVKPDEKITQSSTPENTENEISTEKDTKDVILDVKEEPDQKPSVDLEKTSELDKCKTEEKTDDILDIKPKEISDVVVNRKRPPSSPNKSMMAKKSCLESIINRLGSQIGVPPTEVQPDDEDDAESSETSDSNSTTGSENSEEDAEKKLKPKPINKKKYHEMVMHMASMYVKQQTESLQKRVKELEASNEAWKAQAQEMSAQIMDLTTQQSRYERRRQPTRTCNATRNVAVQVDGGKVAQIIEMANNISPRRTQPGAPSPKASGVTVKAYQLASAPQQTLTQTANGANSKGLLSLNSMKPVAGTNKHSTVRSMLGGQTVHLQTVPGNLSTLQAVPSSASTSTTSSVSKVKVIDLTEEGNKNKVAGLSVLKPGSQIVGLPINSNMILQNSNKPIYLQALNPGQIRPNMNIVYQAPSNVVLPPGASIQSLVSTASTQSSLIRTAMTSNQTTVSTVTTPRPPPPLTRPPPPLQSAPNKVVNTQKQGNVVSKAKGGPWGSGHPAPLPPMPQNQQNASKKLPQKPGLKISRVPNGIVLSWNMQVDEVNHAKIVNYQLYAYQESPDMVPKISLWKKVGEVKALPLPMACTLTQFQEGNKYHFAVRAIDEHTRVGQFSEPSSIHLTPNS